MNLITTDQLSKKDIARLITGTQAISKNIKSYSKNLNGKILANIILEPSTRTQHSFESAMYKMGGNVITLNNNSSTKKGESEEDTVKTMSYYADVLVIRHSEVGKVEALAKQSLVPVINAGDGSHEHPTQGLLDLYTIYSYKHLDNTLKILFTGDLEYSRTVPSLINLLKTWGHWKTEITFANPISKVLEKLTNPIGFKVIPEELISSFLPKVDVVYMTRPQIERHTNTTTLNTTFILDNRLANTMNDKALIMSPGPRNQELNPDTDKNPRSMYWQQVKNGLLMRMAILQDILQEQMLHNISLHNLSS